MGFGIALFGYAFLLLEEFGGAAIGAVLLGYGLFLASRLEKSFLNASVSALFMLPRGIVMFLMTCGFIDVNAKPVLNFTTFSLFLAAWLFTNTFWLKGVQRIAKENAAEKLYRQAGRRLSVTACFILLSLGLIPLQASGNASLLGFSLPALQVLLEKCIILVNVLFMHTCFVLITSESQYEKDKQYIASENAKILEKQEKDRKKEAEYEKKHSGRNK